MTNKKAPIIEFFTQGILQLRIWKKIYPGVMHFLIFWGVTIQIVGTAINLMQMALFTPFALEHFPRNGWYFFYEFIMDLAGVFILVGVGMALFRRLVTKPKYLGYAWDDWYALILLTLIPLAGFTTEAMRLISADPLWAGYSFAGSIFASLFRAFGVTPESAFGWQQTFVLIHIFLGVAFVASIPFTKLRHLIFAPLNIIRYPRRAMGALEKVEDIEETELLGVGKITEFNSQQLLSFDACLRCGRCEDVCPCTNSGMSYSPRLLITDLREAMLKSLIAPNGTQTGDGVPSEDGVAEIPELVDHTFGEHDLWSCTTCGACLTRCPAFINPPEQVVDLRRYQVLTTGNIPKSVGDTLRNMERQGNPWGMPPENRLSWAEGLAIRELAPGDEVEVLLFVGCAAAFDERNKKVVQSFARLLKKAEVDFGVLGFDEACCGETARRMGHEYIFQVMAEQNIEIFNEIKFQRIVTACPHCFNTLKNEYPQMGGEYEVLHYSEMLNRLITSGKLPTNGQQNGSTITYHDSCYLGRYNDIYSAPREILDKAGTHRIELSRKGENSFCCGGGGGMMWMETDPNTRINNQRLEEVLNAKVDTVATACPYCLTMFDDAIRTKAVGEQVKVVDIVEVLEAKMK